MASIISKIKLINFKRFRNHTVIPNEKMNILVGDNKVGKSSVLEAINMVSSGNIKRTESMGIDSLFNIDSTNMNSDYATNDFVKRMYLQYTESDVKERATHNSLISTRLELNNLLIMHNCSEIKLTMLKD